MPEEMVIPIAIGVILLCCAFSFGIGRWLAKRSDFRTGKREFLLASLTPTLLISVAIMSWQIIDTIGMTAEQRTEYMGPALIFLYGAPWLGGNLLANILAAIAGLNRV